MNNFTKVVRDFEDVAEFVIVYICEAHPTDEWRWNVSVLFCFRALLATNAAACMLYAGLILSYLPYTC